MSEFLHQSSRASRQTKHRGALQQLTTLAYTSSCVPRDLASPRCYRRKALPPQSFATALTAPPPHATTTTTHDTVSCASVVASAGISDLFFSHTLSRSVMTSALNRTLFFHSCFCLRTSFLAAHVCGEPFVESPTTSSVSSPFSARSYQYGCRLHVLRRRQQYEQQGERGP
jgi:hypothetical protein